MSHAVKSKTIFIIGLLFFSILSTINIGNPMNATIEDESPPQASGDASTADMVKPSKVDFALDGKMVSSGIGSHTPLTVDVLGDLVCQGGFFSDNLNLGTDVSLSISGMGGYLYCENSDGEFGTAFASSTSNAATVQDLKILSETEIAVIGTFIDGVITGSFVSILDISSGISSPFSSQSTVINHCVKDNLRQIELVKIDGTSSGQFIVGTVRNHGTGANTLCESSTSSTNSSGDTLHYTAADSNESKDTSSHKSFLIDYSSNNIQEITLESTPTVHFTSVEYFDSTTAYISYYMSERSACGESFHNEAGYYTWEKGATPDSSTLTPKASTCGEHLKFRDITASGTSVFLIGDASELNGSDCVTNHDCSGFGGLDVVVFSAEDGSGVLLGGKLLDYGFSIEAYGSELIIGGSFETSTTSFGLSATDEEDGFVASIDISAAEFTINWANGVGGMGIDLVTSTAINTENNNVYVSAMVTESGKAGSIDYVVYDSEHLFTKSFVGYLNVSDVLPVPNIHNYQALDVAFNGAASSVSPAAVHHLEASGYDVLEYRFSGLETISVEAYDSSIHVNGTATSSSKYTTLFLILETGVEFPTSYFLAENTQYADMCAIDNQYLTFACLPDSSSNYYEYEPLTQTYDIKDTHPVSSGTMFWSSKVYQESVGTKNGYCQAIDQSDSAIEISNSMFTHLGENELVYKVKNTNKIIKFDILECNQASSTPVALVETYDGEIAAISGNSDGESDYFLIQTQLELNSGCRTLDFDRLSTTTLARDKSYAIEYCPQAGETLGTSNLLTPSSFLSGEDLHISSGFTNLIDTVTFKHDSISPVMIYSQVNNDHVSLISTINTSTDEFTSEKIYSSNVLLTPRTGLLDEGIKVTCLSDPSAPGSHLSYGDDFSGTMSMDSICLAIGSNEVYSYAEYNALTTIPTEYGFATIDNGNMFYRYVYSFIHINTADVPPVTEENIEYDGRKIFVDYNSDFSIQFMADLSKKQPNKWSMELKTTGATGSWLTMSETGMLNGSYNLHVENINQLPCLEYTLTAEYDNPANDEEYDAHYSHDIEICVQSVEVEDITYGSNNTIVTVYGGGITYHQPQYQGGPISNFTVSPVSADSAPISIDSSGKLSLNSNPPKPAEGNYTIGYEYSRHGELFTPSIEVNISVDYTIVAPTYSGKLAITPNLARSIEFDLSNTALIDAPKTQLTYIKPVSGSSVSFECSTLNADSFSSHFDEATRILTINSSASAANGCENFTDEAGELLVTLANDQKSADISIPIETVPELQDYEVVYEDKEVQKIFGVFSVNASYKGHKFHCTECTYQLDPDEIYRAGVYITDTGQINYVANPDPTTEEFTVLITYPSVSGSGDKTVRASFNLTTLHPQPVFAKNKMHVEIISGQSIYYPPESPGISNTLEWMIDGGALPAGLSIDPVTGVITGTTNDIGPHIAKIKARSDISFSDSYTLSLDVIAPPSEAHFATNHINVFGNVELDPIMLQNDVNNQGDWVANISVLNPATGEWEIRDTGMGLEDRHLGLSIDKNGTISGVPLWDMRAEGELIEIYVNLTSEFNYANKPSIQITIHKPTFQEPRFDEDNIEITTIRGTDFAFNPPTAHAKISTWTLTPADTASNSAWLSSGFTFDEETGSIFGISQINTPNMELVITATTNMQQKDSFNLNITILNPGLSSIYYPHTTLHLLEGEAMQPFAPVIPNNRNLQFVSPNLPAGLSIDSSTGVISGTPTLQTNVSDDSMAIYQIVVDEPHVTENSTIELIIHIHDPRADLSFALDSTNVSFVLGEPIDFELQYPGGTGTLSWTTSTLPAGLTLYTDSGSAWITGRPIDTGTFSVEVAVADSTTADVTYTQVITVVEKDPLLHYAMNKMYMHLGQDINDNPICPDIEISIERYEISPMPVSNLVFDSSNGCISGSPSVVSNPPIVYTIEGFTATGKSTTFDLELVVSGVRSDYFLVDTPAFQVIDYRNIINYPYHNQYLTYGSYLAYDVPESKVGTLSQFTIHPSIDILGDQVSFDQTTGTLSGLPTYVTPEGGITFTINATWEYILADGTLVSSDVSTEYHVIVEAGELNFINTRFVVGEVLSIEPNIGYQGFDEYELYGQLPVGVSFDSKTGTFTGTPQESGEYSYHIVARAADGSSVDYYLEFEVQESETNPWKVVFIFAIIGLLFAIRRIVDDFNDDHTTSADKDFGQHFEEE